MNSKGNPQVKITNIVSKTHLISPFSLSRFSLAFPFSEEKTYLHRVYLPYRNINFSVFRSGAIISRSSTSLSELESSFEWLRSLLTTFALRVSNSYELLNIVSTISIAPALNLLPLVEYLPNSSYDPSPLLTEAKREFHVNAIVHYFAPNEKPRRTALVFATGRVVLTGFNEFSDIDDAVMSLSKLLSEIVEAHSEVLK
jgi:TATA-box binding protein (TBP) (component of TFIID and TFIIIB)